MPGKSLKDLAPFKLTIGPDDATSILDSGFTFSNVDPGGFEAASFSLPRDLPQTLRGQYVRLDSGLGVAWEGRVSQIQRSLGHRTQINCEGYGALLKDAAQSMVFVDRDLTRWQQPSYPRQDALIVANFQLRTSQIGPDTVNNLPAIVQTIQDSWASPFKPIGEVWYDSGPNNLISAVYYNVFSRVSGTSWVENVVLSSDANLTIQEVSANLWQAAGATSTGYFIPATAYRFAMLQHYWSATAGAGTQGATFNGYWRNIAAYGNHGILGRGPDPVGFFPSDIFGWVISQAPGLQAGTIQATDASNYIVAHSAYYMPTTLNQMANDMAVQQGWHWGVWESLAPLTGSPLPRADFTPRPAPGAFTAFCLRQDCDTLDIREDLSQQFNQAVVTFSDTGGVQQAVTVTVDNPILDQANIASRTVIFNGGTMTPATATLFAAEALALTNSQARVAGTADIISAIDGGTRAPWMLHAGQDRLRIGDAPTTDAFGTTSDYPVSRVECSVSNSGITTALELGQGASLIETLQARLSAATFLAGQGGA